MAAAAAAATAEVCEGVVEVGDGFDARAISHRS